MVYDEDEIQTSHDEVILSQPRNVVLFLES